MVDMVAIVVVELDADDDDSNGIIGFGVVVVEVEALLVMVRSNRWDRRVPFPHVHNIEMELRNIPTAEMTKLRLLWGREMDLAKSNIMELMTVNMTWDHQLIHEVRCNTLAMCRIKTTRDVEDVDVAASLSFWDILICVLYCGCWWWCKTIDPTDSVWKLHQRRGIVVVVVIVGDVVVVALVVLGPSLRIGRWME